MADLDSLVAQQRDAAYVVNRALDNFKKIGKLNYTVATVRNRIAKLEDAFKECQSLNRQIIASANAEQRQKLAYFTENQFVILHEMYLESSDFMAEVLERLEEKTNADANINIEGNEKGTQSTGGSITTNDHLPRKNLPTFSGDLVEWESFRDRFTSMIIDNSTVSEVSKLEYLFSCLQLEPLDTIRNLAITKANFQIAWELLTKRYDNNRRLITAHVQSLLNLPCADIESKAALAGIRDRVHMSTLALKSLGCSVESWDEMLVCLVVNCLDETSRRDWEFELGTSTEFPKFQDLDDFLEKRIRSLEALSITASTANIPSARSSTSRSGPPRAAQSHMMTPTERCCPLCKADHPLHRCKTFRDKTVSQRFEYVKKGNRCINCLSTKHNVRSCPSANSCQTCKKRHHTLLHFEHTPRSGTDREASIASTTSDANTTRMQSHSVLQTTALSTQILLATARINVHSTSNRTQRVRALLDQGSVVSIINENLAQRLRTPRSRVSISITGVGDGETRCTAATTLTIASTHRTDAAYSTNALIVKSLSNYLPHRFTGNFNLEYIRGLDLADDTPFSQDPIEMIIGADVYGSLLLDGVRKGDPNQPVAQNTTLGWILSGPLPIPPSQPFHEIHTHHTITSDALNIALREFWEIEELPAQSHLTPAEKECDNHFVATHTRTTTGQYCVRLPFVQGPPIGIGSSFPAAKVMWSRQEQRIHSNPTLAAEYSAFMKEYHDLGHMSEIRDPEPISSQTVYIPHHAVIRETSATTHLRVVFNASCKSSNGTSLNDHLLVGPKLQTELPAVILRWRLHRYVYIADIAKMYRQILVDDRDVDYQRIMWRPNPAEAIRHYQLRTVTYGTAPAPYLALRVLKQLTLDDGSKYPLAGPILKNQIYVDDCLFGADKKELARQTRDQLIALLKGAGLRLRKWASNSPGLMSDIDPTDHGLAGGKTLQPDESLKVLGVTWNPDTDSFRFDVTLEKTVPNSKRAILSTIAKLFDPLGWVTPVVITAKIIMQELWRLNCDWDAGIPPDIHAVWATYFKQLPCLRQISLPRWIHHGSSVRSVELHGFADASNQAYAAVTYLRVTMQNGEVAVSLLAAKSKVAPVKSLSIPRLELCAATLLARLVSFINTTLDLHVSRIYCWTDSTIVLAWIAQTPSRWKVFVANRVAEVQLKLPTAQWNHVPTSQNPADCASRGFDASTFRQHSLWWDGPEWLKNPPSHWPSDTPPLKKSAELEERPAVSAHTVTPGEAWDLATRFSQWSKLIRVTAYICRFIARLRNTSKIDEQSTPSQRALTTDEIQRARIFWLKYIQRNRYLTELDCLRNRQPLPRSSTLLPLNVFLDNDDLIRVGGRLRNAEMLEETKHPIVLASHPLVNLLISSIHIRALHAGPQLTLSTLRQEFWLLRARPIIRAVIHRCVPCTRERAAIASELMGDLPAPRVNRAERAFLHTGVDYAGPVLVRTTAGRGYKARKSYIALFVCLTSRAIHLELVSDYSSAAFVACFDRFCSRRGLPHTMYSDNGTTFQGADKEIAESFREATHDINFLNKLATDQISWKFIPPAAPHFGGLWEAGVRSTKHHMKRVIGSHTLTFEELTTVLCRIEACLNSRPLAPTSDHVDDYSAITPGHFLIGSALNAVPAPTLLDVRENRLSRWQLLRQLSESFWRAWSTDYVHTLQQRPKWRVSTNLAKPGRIVLIKNSLAPPCKWDLGRILRCHPGHDGVSRVVTVKTAQGEYKRPITQLCFLPVDINTEEEELNTSADDKKGDSNGTS